jgi:hypothetical protein
MVHPQKPRDGGGAVWFQAASGLWEQDAGAFGCLPKSELTKDNQYVLPSDLGE